MTTPSPRPQLINYGKDQEQFGVLRLPKDKGPHPVVAVIHGGAWLAINDLDYMNPISSALADAGIAAWNIEYRRLGNGGGFPATFQDVAHAVDHLRVLAPMHNLDLGRAVILGHSSGATLALWAAARQRIPLKSVLRETAKNALAVRTVIALSGLYDLRVAAENNLAEGAVPKLLGGTVAKFAERYTATSPIEMLPLGIPQILMHGAADDRVPSQTCKDYQSAAVAKGDDAKLISLRGVGHFELVNPRAPEWKQVLAAIQTTLK